MYLKKAHFTNDTTCFIINSCRKKSERKLVYHPPSLHLVTYLWFGDMQLISGNLGNNFTKEKGKRTAANS